MRDENNPEDVHIYRDESHFVAAVLAFRPLKYLRIQVIWSVKALQRILIHHGGSLRGLAIQPSATLFEAQDRADAGYKFPQLDSHQIREMATLCPNLSEFSLQITRSTDDFAEWDMYRALGQFPFLHTLFLDLQCDPREHPLHADVELLYEEIFINVVTDETLAIAIWNVISSNQVSKKLRNLCCTPFGQPFYPATVNYVLSILGKSFLVRRLDSQATNHLEVTAIAEEKRHTRMQTYMEEMMSEYLDNNEDDIQDMGSLSPILDEEIEDLLYVIWPGIDWRTSWHSFPPEGNHWFYPW